MPAYRNRPDRRKPPPQDSANVVSNPVMTFVCELDNDSIGTITFDQPIIHVDGTDPKLLNSIRIWWPQGGYTGTCVSCVQTGPAELTVNMGCAPGTGDELGVWIFDQVNLIRGLNTGARCTGNPNISEAVP